MKYEVDEILNMAIMSKTPHLVVEGVDDICIYEAIAKEANVECEVYAIQMIDGFTGGNNGVIDAIDALENMTSGLNVIPSHFVLGIIDRDTRPYRNDLPANATVLMLKYYSIESHFVSKEVIVPAIQRLTRNLSNIELNLDEMMARIEQNISNLYYFSLDALRNAVDSSYQQIIGFSTNIGRRNDDGTIRQLAARSSQLDSFALRLNLDSSIDSMREFVKGKWILTAFSEELFNEIELLKLKCKDNLIQQCRMCTLDQSAPCLYSVKEGFTKKTLYPTLCDFVHIAELDYIRQRIRLIADTSKQSTPNGFTH